MSLFIRKKNRECQRINQEQVALLNTSRTRIRLLMTAYSPLRIASLELGRLSVTLETDSKTLPIEFVLGMPMSLDIKTLKIRISYITQMK